MTTYTIKQIAKELNIGESTIRYWRDRYEEHIPCIGQGRKRQYTPEVLNVLRFISECSANGLNAEQTKEALSDEYGVIGILGNNATAQQRPPAPVKGDIELFVEAIGREVSPLIGQLMDKLNQLDRLESIEQELKRSNAAREQQAQENQQLKNQLAEMKSKIDRLQKTVKSLKHGPKQMELFQDKQEQTQQHSSRSTPEPGTMDKVVPGAYRRESK